MAVEAIVKAGGSVTNDYDYDPSGKWAPRAGPRSPAWLRKLLGGYFFADVTDVCFDDTEVGDAAFGYLQGLTQLQRLSLLNVPLTDAGLAHVDGFTKIRELGLSGTRITDAGLEHLRCLKQLQILLLRDTQVTDAGLVYVEGSTGLRELYLDRTQVADAGLKHLVGLKQLQELELSSTRVTDAGLEHLEGLTQLKYLNLVGTAVTAAGFHHLKRLSGLQELHISAIADIPSPEEEAELQRAYRIAVSRRGSDGPWLIRQTGRRKQGLERQRANRLMSSATNSK